eukprot:3340475-Pyramimonas_sp.AAC.1
MPIVVRVFIRGDLRELLHEGVPRGPPVPTPLCEGSAGIQVLGGHCWLRCFSRNFEVAFQCDAVPMRTTTRDISMSV